MNDSIRQLIEDHPISRLKEKWGCVFQCANSNAASRPAWTEDAISAGFDPGAMSFHDAVSHVESIYGSDYVCFGAIPDVFLPTEIVRIKSFAIRESEEFMQPSVGGFLFFPKDAPGEDITYIKYNEQRDPRYRLQTEILKDASGKKVVRKTASHPDAVAHLYHILDNGELLHDLYKEIWLVPVERDDDTVYFMFVEGASLLSGIDFVGDSPKDIVKKIRKAMKPIFRFNRKYVTTFKETEGFRKLFGSYRYLDYHRRAVTVCNLDCNFDNFGMTDGDIYCFDYEWAVDFPVPIDYLKVRTLRFLYELRHEELSAKFGRPDNFVFAFGFIPEEYNIYTRMEEAFQQHVHGRDYKYRYSATYSGDPVEHTQDLPYTTPRWKWILKKIYRRISPLVLPLE